MLMAHILRCERIRLYMDADRPASAEELQTLRALVGRAGQHEPVQYLVGEAWLFGLPFSVDRSTLIPRPSTETLLEHVLQRIRENGRPDDDVAQVPEAQEITDISPGGGLRLADLGTGTGCIAISLARRLPAARIVATDVVDQALELARSNARRHGVVDQIDFRLGPLFEPLSAGEEVGRFDFLCSTPPDIPDHEWDEVERNVKDYEPASALRGGPDGLDVIRLLIAGAGRWLRPGGQLVVEIAHCQRDAAVELVAQTDDLAAPKVLKDHDGYWRVLVADRVGEG
jgi:release factor glutamine methyltransferase